MLSCSHEEADTIASNKRIELQNWSIGSLISFLIVSLLLLLLLPSIGICCLLGLFGADDDDDDDDGGGDCIATYVASLLLLLDTIALSARPCRCLLDGVDVANDIDNWVLLLV